VTCRSRSARPSFGRGIRTAVVRTDQRYLADARRRLDQLTLHGTFAEALAFVTGYDAARASSYLAGFQQWLTIRGGAPKGTPLADLIRSAAGADADDGRTTATLFDLLDEYLETKGPD
jgi:hypothetical protein